MWDGKDSTMPTWHQHVLNHWRQLCNGKCTRFGTSIIYWRHQDILVKAFEGNHRKNAHPLFLFAQNLFTACSTPAQNISGLLLYCWIMTQRWFDLGHYFNHCLHLQFRVLLPSLFSIIKAIIMTNQSLVEQIPVRFEKPNYTLLKIQNQQRPIIFQFFSISCSWGWER